MDDLCSFFTFLQNAFQSIKFNLGYKEKALDLLDCLLLEKHKKCMFAEVEFGIRCQIMFFLFLVIVDSFYYN